MTGQAQGKCVVDQFSSRACERGTKGCEVQHVSSAAQGHELARVTWDRNSDLMRTQLQATGRIRLAFISLDGILAVVNDLGIDPAEVGFYRGYAVVGDAWKDIPA